METVDKRLLLQSDTFDKVRKAYTNFKKSSKDRITTSYIQGRMDMLETYFREFKGQHEKLVMAVSQEEKLTLRYFTADMYSEFEEMYYSYRGDMMSNLKTLLPEKSSESIVSTKDASNTNTFIEEIQLPRIQLPTFKGNYTEWQSFHDMFMALVHKNGKLENVQKLHYLKSSLVGEAEVLLRQFPITGENYIEAWSILKKRYSNKRYIANCVFKKFFGQKIMTQESAMGLKQLLDTTVECISSLKNLGLPTSQWDGILNFVVVSKLDPMTHKQWEENISSDKSDDLPNFERLKSFLEMRFRTLEMVDKPNQSVIRPRTCHIATTESKEQCAYCKENHYIYKCKQFAKETADNKYNFVQKNRLCFNCLIPNHTVFQCRQKTSCQICKGKHHSLLHRDKNQTGEQRRENDSITNKNQDYIQPKVAAHMVNGQPTGQNILLATALVGVTSSSGQTHVLRALIDQGSEASFVTARVVELLGLKKTKTSGVVSGIGEGNKQHIKQLVDLQIKSRYDDSFSFNVNAYVLKSLTRILPAREVKVYSWPKLNNLKLADPTFNTPGRIDILLGADIFGKIIDSGFMRGPGNLVAQFTHLGWILSGDVGVASNSSQHITSLHITRQVEEDNNLLKKFWEVETDLYTNKKMWSKEEEKCEEIYQNTTKRDSTGRYVVQLPLKTTIEETVKLCGDTKELAIRRFKQLERKFERNEKIREDYTRVIQEYLTLGHMKKAETEDNPESIYLAHHAVFREDKDTSKVRVVFDASAKGSNGCSLNSSMMVGPIIQPDLRNLIVRWRSHKICVVGDIVKMYRQIRMTDKHTDLQRIVWRDDTTKEIESYQLLTVTFGTAAAPYLAVRTLMQLADDEAEKFPSGAAVVKNSYYMDDLMTGHEDLSQIKDICDEINKLLMTGGFQMQKWSSNSDKLLKILQEGVNGVEPVKETVKIKLDKIIKILGLVWDRREDNFKITVNLPEIRNPVTKRNILSDVASLFDPFGWLSPVVISAKIMIQKLWLCSLGWDDDLPLHLVNEWLNFREELYELQTIKIPRWIRMTSHCKDVQLHGFSDASSLAMAAVVYVRVVNEYDEVFVTIIASKTKVAPLKQLTIPRLELCAAVLLAKLLREISILLNIQMEKIYAWTDSMVVLSWLQSQPSRWQVFVGNRVSDIIQHIDNDRWRHVSSGDNPADLGSRGIKASELPNNELWWTGPRWLKEKDKEYIRKPIIETKLEIKQNLHVIIEDAPIWERFSSMSRMKRVLAHCRRLLNYKARKKNRESLSVLELNEIEERCVKYYQQLVFGQEIEDLKKNGKIKKKSALITLTPFLDKNSLLRVGGRLRTANMNEEAKHPIIVPGKQHVTSLIINEAHVRTLHGGILQMMTYIRSKYWIIGLKSAVRLFTRKCTVCIRDKALIKQQLMGQLPVSRITPQRAFFNSGVDYAGPIHLRTSKGRGHKSMKGYICLFVCMCTKAIHLEAVTDLTAQAFISAFRRFVARRGHCSHLWSDNGTNFVGADKELRYMFQRGKNNVAKEIADILANDGTSWHFIPPRSPNFGGLWEAGVRSVKKHLSRVNGTTKLTYEEMSTLLAQVEACLNSRPLCQLDETVDTLNPLTPGHFLIGEPLVTIPDITYEYKEVNLLTRWQLIQSKVKDFWIRWKSEYLHTLQQRYKWQQTVPSPGVGDIVIIKDEDLPPAKWLLEADYTLDDSFWNEESPVGEVERLLREYRQNQELVRNIGAHYYQIIYPVQLRHHEKMGISTREVNTPKGRGYDYQQGTRSRARTGKHFHRTSLLIKAFNHKFRLDLELNTQLLAPNLKQTQYLANGAESDIRTEIEHCYYHGTVKDYPGASAAFHTCNGVSGVIHIGNETFVIHPFYGGDLSQKHPHVIFEARTKANKGCANKLEFRPKSRRTKHVSYVEEPLGDDPGTIDSSSRVKDGRSWRWWQDAGLRSLNRRRRDVRETTKYIETALVIDKAMFDRRNGSTRSEVVHDAIQVANIADLYFRTLNTRVSLVYIESWQSADQADIDRKQDITRAIHKFSDYTARKLFKIEKDTTQLLTGLTFPGGESGISVPDTLCTPKSVGISVDTNTYEPHLLAGTMAHMIGHNIGMGHDDGREQCFCRDWHGCIMAQSIVGSDNVQPYKFSDCSKNDYINELRVGQGLCLLNKPNELVIHHQCGNGRLDEGEECDCGTITECQNTNPCCDPFTCRLTKESQCASGECCDRCQLKPRGVVCRDASNECDLEETCTGLSGSCPPDAHRKNGEPCEESKGYCFAGQCPTLSLQCERIWGQGTIGADKECFEQFNSKGAVTGHCGKDGNGHFVKCETENVRCGSLQCQLGNRYPIVSGMDEYYTRTVISIKGNEYECKATTGLPKHSELAPLGLVRDGTPCGDNLVCVNQTCTSIFPYIDHTKCPTDHNNNECSGKGVCSNLNKCVCNRGWTGPDCSHHDALPPSPTPYTPENATKAAYNMTKKETPYGEHEGNKMSTMNMVILLLAVVLSVFVGFAWMAYCFRRKSTARSKYNAPYTTNNKPMIKNFTAGSTTSNNSQEDISDAGGKHSFNNAFSRGDSQRVIFRHGNHMSGSTSSGRYSDHKQLPKRIHSGSEDEPIGSGEEDIAFIDVAPNSMAKLPEKGILKKHGYGAVDGKDKWGDDSQSEQLEAGSQSDGQEPSGAVADMEYKFKDLNGYHENIIVALKTAAAQRASAGGSSGSGDLRALQEYEYSKRERAPSAEKIHETDLRRRADDEEDEPPQCGPIRIRNLEDLIRQLEHHSSRHMSPSGSEDIRMSETEADRHYRIEPGDIPPRCRGRSEDAGFGYPRFRGSGRHHGRMFTEAVPGGVGVPVPLPPLVPHVPHSSHSPHGRPPPDDDALYETADAERLRDAPDSESDEFIQAQQQLARWASEEVVAAGGPTPGALPRGYFPSPVDSSSSEANRGPLASAFPEYTH